MGVIRIQLEMELIRETVLISRYFSLGWVWKMQQLNLETNSCKFVVEAFVVVPGESLVRIQATEWLVDFIIA